jgi:hypothetical protein
MNNVLLMMLLCLSLAFGADTTGTWNGGSSVMTLASNYNWSPAEPATPFNNVNVLLVFDNTSVANSTAGSNVSVKSFTTTSVYSGNMSFAGRTLSANRIFFDGTGTLNFGNGITMGGVGDTLHIGSGVGTTTQNSCVIKMTGNKNYVDFDKQIIGFSRFEIGKLDTTINIGNSKFYCVSYSAISPIILDTNSSLVLMSPIAGGRSGTTGISLITILQGATLSGASYLQLFAATNNSVVTLPGLTTAVDSLNLSAGTAPSTNGTINQSGAIVLNSGNIEVINQSPTSIFTYNTNGLPIKCGVLSTGSTNNSGSCRFNFGASLCTLRVFNASSYNYASVTNDTDDFGSSQIIVSDSIIGGSYHVTMPGTSVFLVKNTGKFTLRPNGIKFNSLLFNPGTSAIDSITGRLTAVRFEVKSGRVKGLPNGISVSDSVIIGGTDTAFGRGASALSDTVNHFKISGTGVRLIDSMPLVFPNGGTYDHVDSSAVKSISFGGAVGKKLVLAAGKKIILRSPVSKMFSGSSGNLDSIVSSSAGSSDTIQSQTPVYNFNTYVKDTYFKGGLFRFGFGSVDGGGNGGNVSFTSAASFYPDKTVDTISRAIASKSIASLNEFDSVTFVGAFPAGITGTKSTGLISGIPTEITPQSIIKALIWSGGSKIDSCYDTLTIVGVMGHSMITNWNAILSTSYYYETNHAHRNSVNKGIGGTTITQLEPRVDSCLTAYHPNRFFMWIGQNELAIYDSATFNAALPAYWVTWGSVISKVKAFGITDSIYVCGCSPVGYDAMRARNYKRLNSYLLDSCRANGLYYINMWDSLLKPGTIDTLNPLYTADNIHPNSTTLGAQTCARLFTYAYIPGLIDSITPHTKRDPTLRAARRGDTVTIHSTTDIGDSTELSVVYLGRDLSGEMQITRWFNAAGLDSVWCIVPADATLNKNYRPRLVSGLGEVSTLQIPVTWREPYILNVKGQVR